MRWLAFVLVLFPVAAFADAPKSLELPAGWETKSDQPYEDVRYDHLPLHFIVKGDSKPHDVDPKGRMFRGFVFAPTGGAAPDQKSAVEKAADHLQKTGWTVDQRDGLVIAHRSVNGHDHWVKVSPTPKYWSVELVEEGNQPRIPKVVAPTAKIETVKDTEDFPYIGHFEGMTLESTKTDPGIFAIPHPGGKVESVWGPIVSKHYSSKEDVSPYECIIGYREALKKTGWVIDDDHPLGNMSNGTVQAHYANAGRDLHVSILCNHKRTEVRLLDGAAAAEVTKLKKQLEEQGHIALYGIYFDIDAATLKAESEATLQEIAKLLALDPKLKLEVQGHTDDTGSADHNQELSEKRAASVKKWLVEHKVDAGRLTIAGYGATKPVADNKSPEGRAKNRRVELAKK
ncbi:MAG: OmpA family protein [Polyangiales bacterium]